MTIGQWRSSGSKAYLLWGVFLLVGALVSFLVTGWERHRLAADRPEQLLKIWQRHAESRSSNPFLYAARHMEFMDDRLSAWRCQILDRKSTRLNSSHT